MIEIPLSDVPAQKFSTIINGATYQMRVIWNTRRQTWTMDIAQEGEDILVGLTLVGGVDLMKQYTFPIKNMFMVNVDDSSADISRDGLGTASKLLILTDEEVASAASV